MYTCVAPIDTPFTSHTPPPSLLLPFALLFSSLLFPSRPFLPLSLTPIYLSLPLSLGTRLDEPPNLSSTVALINSRKEMSR